ncbi:uncharacterized protein ACA1_083090 [Acanthamoeba castellanii str. Neff]|uniref:Uncharacterized protein n=1 Tax=Acanthamoeba castellanii (strain ATCC 30010 / Neff) TaxID=1257118 RepID=L8HEZ7_ACACF|nr:uncharacterized protein ACA1_083090 [Acanthamoeba castellanii str. Neff]ELR23817.1 hypothetical protein ACA1_083090 [Acanthamoeba castellanii str. Neff]
MSQVVMTRGPRDGQKLSKTVTDASKIEQLLASAEAIQAPTSIMKVKWTHDVDVMTVQLSKPVGVFTDGVVEVWGEGRRLRVPGQTSYSFYPSSESDQTAKLASDVGELWNSA